MKMMNRVALYLFGLFIITIGINLSIISALLTGKMIGVLTHYMKPILTKLAFSQEPSFLIQSNG